MIANIQGIINDLHSRNIIESRNMKIEKLSGTTDGLVLLLTDDQSAYILKNDNNVQVKLVNRFLQAYDDVELFPSVLYSDLENNFFVYSYIRGTTHFNRGLKRNWLNKLVTEVLNNYIAYDEDEFWGRFEVPRLSWYEFNKTSIDETRNSVIGVLSDIDHHFINKIAIKLQGRTRLEERYLLHGDTGVHNFVFDQNSLVGIIDPSPMRGPILYDFLYAFCSSPDDLNIETLLDGFNLLEDNTLEHDVLILEVLVQLYCRIGIAIRHHPHDLPEYLGAWEYWKALCK